MGANTMAASHFFDFRMRISLFRQSEQSVSRLQMYEKKECKTEGPIVQKCWGSGVWVGSIFSLPVSLPANVKLRNKTPRTLLSGRKVEFSPSVFCFLVSYKQVFLCYPLFVMEYTQWDYVVLSLAKTLKIYQGIYFIFLHSYSYIFFAFSIADKRTFQIVFSPFLCDINSLWVKRFCQYWASMYLPTAIWQNQGEFLSFVSVFTLHWDFSKAVRALLPLNTTLVSHNAQCVLYERRGEQRSYLRWSIPYSPNHLWFWTATIGGGAFFWFPLVIVTFPLFLWNIPSSR